LQNEGEYFSAVIMVIDAVSYSKHMEVNPSATLNAIQSAEKFVDNLRWELIQNKQRKTRDLILELIEKEFPEQKQIESIFKLVQEVGMIPFYKLNIQEHGEQEGIPKQDLLDLLETI